MVAREDKRLREFIKMSNIDKIFRDKLSSYGVKPKGSDKIWDSIYNDLYGGTKNKVVYFNFRKKLLALVSACAAIANAFYFIFEPFSIIHSCIDFNQHITSPF